MSPSRASRLLHSFFLGRLGLALILLFVINTLFGLLPLQLLDPAWQLRIADLLRTTAPFTLLGAALIYLAGVPSSGVNPPAPPPRRSRGGPHTSVGWPCG